VKAATNGKESTIARALSGKLNGAGDIEDFPFQEAVHGMQRRWGLPRRKDRLSKNGGSWGRSLRRTKN